ncbi:MAG TPA: hypothetical protein VKW78_00580 [Terriglobales bacterium]|nr:hypothetical protein [Terriglobales bacterium]
MQTKAILRFLCGLFLVLLISGAALAQESYPKYDKATEVKIKGEVQELKVHHTEAGDNTHLIVKAGDQLYEVCLCPAEFLKSMEVTFAAGDKVEITGSKAKLNGADVILAREIVRGDNTLVIRDKEGAPVWTWMMKKG